MVHDCIHGVRELRIDTLRASLPKLVYSEVEYPLGVLKYFNACIP